MIARQCYMESLQTTPRKTLLNKMLDLRDEQKIKRAASTDELLQVPFDERLPDRFFRISLELYKEDQAQLINFLRKNVDIFAWSASDMPGVSPDVITHKLNVNPAWHSIIQKKRSFPQDRAQAIQEEVTKFLEAGFIREVEYPKWLTNVVLVKKSNGKWRVCVDYTDLNKACPKDCYPLPSIDLLVDATSGFPLMSFMDAFSGYN